MLKVLGHTAQSHIIIYLDKCPISDYNNQES